MPKQDGEPTKAETAATDKAKELRAERERLMQDPNRDNVRLTEIDAELAKGEAKQ